MLDVAHTLIVTTFFLKERAVSPAFTGDNRLSGEIFTHLKARRTLIDIDYHNCPAISRIVASGYVDRGIDL